MATPSSRRRVDGVEVDAAIQDERRNLVSTQVVAALQRWRLLLSPEQHQKHHRTHDSDFCIVTGHTDPLVNWVYGTALRRLWAFAAVSREEERRFDEALDAVYGAIY